MEGVKTQILRIFITFFLILILVSLFLEIVLYSMTGQTLKTQLGNKCLGISIAVAAMLEEDTEAFNKYINTMDTGSDYYKRTKAEIEKIRSGNADNISFLYVEKRVSDTEMIYLLDGEKEGSDSFSEPGSIEIVTDSNNVCYDTGKPHVGDFEITTWGNLLSAHVPVHDQKTGKILAVVSTDVSYEQYDCIMRNQRLVILVNTSVFALSVIASLLVFSNSIEKMLFTDALTGVYNKNFFMNFIKDQCKTLGRKDNSAIVFMVDVDDLKIINNTYGYVFGDKILSNIAMIMRAYMRKTDCLARYGGEEFAGVMPGLSMERAYEVMERIREAVSQTVTFYEGGKDNEMVPVKITVSIGAAPIIKGMKAEQAIQNVSNAVYQAQRTKDTVVFYSEQ